MSTNYGYETEATSLKRLTGVANVSGADNLSRFDYTYGTTGAPGGFKDNRVSQTKTYGSESAQSVSYGYNATSMLTGEGAPAGGASLMRVVREITIRMKKIFCRVLPVLILLVSNTSVQSQPVAPTTASVGQLAPAFQIQDAQGKTRRLKDLRGKKALLLTFFPRCFTGNCSMQLRSLRDSYPTLQKAGIEVWAVSTDSATGPRGQRAFSQHLKLPFPLLPDIDRKISLAYGAVQSKEQMAARMSIFIDKNGVVRSIDKQINPGTHGSDVLAKMRELGLVSVAATKP